jgi:uncharacterized protein (TIGR02001 family)
MKQHTFRTAILVAALSPADGALAQNADAGAANAPDYTTTGNVAVESDYMFRGVTQTWGHPAIQGGGDLTMKNGLAAGFWASSISERSYPGGAMELDLYGSYGANFNDDWSWRAGLYGYVYPGANLDRAKPAFAARSFNTLEANVALTWKWLTLKYSRSLSDYFAIDTEQGYDSDSKGTGYVQLDASLPLSEAWNLSLHAAHTDISARLVTASGLLDPSYSDFGATLKYQFSTHWNASVGATYATNKSFYQHTASFLDPTDMKNVGGSRGFVMLQGTF